MTEKIDRFLRDARPPTPCLVVDLDVVAERYCALRRQMPAADIYYAVKANPAPEILRVLVDHGSRFDVASVPEIELCLSAGASAANLSFGNTIKKACDIATAYRAGVRLYAFDSLGELEKLSRNAPGAQVFCRILVDNKGADWPLSRKFGCDLEMARDLLIRARDLGLEPYGVSFHVGSQQTDLTQWDIAVGRARLLFTDLSEAGIRLKMINVGGGLPAHYRQDVPGVDAYANAIMWAITKHFGNDLPRILVEPGRYMVGDAGVLQSEVVLISRKSYGDPTRWVYLDIGRFGGLAETEGEAIKYRLRTERDGGSVGPAVLAGPTCDSVDVLYEKAAYQLPLDLEVGDRVAFVAAGAYTTTYASVGFNGFAPPKAYFI